MKSLRRLTGLLILGLGTAGCSDAPKVEFHEPGQYKGKSDPLLIVAGTPQHEAQLRERLTKVQTDR